MTQQNLIQNGTFASPALPTGNKEWRNATQYTTFRTDSWDMVSSGGYDHLNATFANHPKGYQAVDLGAEYLQGGIRQTVSTKAGVTYKLTFDCSPNEWSSCLGTSNPFTVKITDDRGGQQIEQRTFDAGTNSGPPPNGSADWQRKEFTFKAAGDRTVVAFHGTGPVGGSCQAAITDVCVIAVDDVSPKPDDSTGTNSGTTVSDLQKQLTDQQNKATDLQRQLTACQDHARQLEQDAKDAAGEYVRGKRKGREDAMKQWQDTGKVTL
ncbi:DUF642 domain-containing protein [Streptomyces sp. NPDC003038]|uniref:DUF642 domain-containing protein n=1 Tax=unclassified Streptomyces TaxID=2593676 RepID=UPI0033A20326